MARRVTAVRGACAIAFLGALAVPSSARAQDKTFSLDRLPMAGGPDDGIAVWRPEFGSRTRFHGQLGLGFALDPLRVENHIDDAHDAAILDDRAGPPVATQLIGYADVGVDVLGRFSFGVELPVIALQTGNPTSTPEIDAPSRVDLMPAALMDLRLDARALLLSTPSPGFKLGVRGALWLPTGNEYSFGGDRAATGALSLALEIDLRRVVVVLDTGPHFRPKAALNDLVVGSEWDASAGVFVPLANGTVRLGAEIFGSTGITDETVFDADNTPLEWMLEGRLATDVAHRGYVGAGAGTRLTGGYAPDLRAVVVAGYSFGIADTDPRGPSRRFHGFAGHGADTDHDGYPDDVDLCPNDPEDGKPPNPDDGCPALPDRDGDGIPDISDRCPDDPEDFDHIEDDDGCPEDDADRDGIPDARDACPKTPGEISPIPSRNGCPRFINPGPGGIDLLQPIEFETGKSRILPKSFPILDEVVKLLQVSPEIAHVEIEGHTDNRGPDELNERLSGERAASVVQYLVDHGVAASRLSAQGFGPRRPRDDNATVDGRRKNRRVEFKMKTAPPSRH